jgi:hypothetical protein
MSPALRHRLINTQILTIECLIFDSQCHGRIGMLNKRPAMCFRIFTLIIQLSQKKKLIIIVTTKGATVVWMRFSVEVCRN